MTNPTTVADRVHWGEAARRSYHDLDAAARVEQALFGSDRPLTVEDLVAATHLRAATVDTALGDLRRIERMARKVAPGQWLHVTRDPSSWSLDSPCRREADRRRVAEYRKRARP
jgi:hypothetical protein